MPEARWYLEVQVDTDWHEAQGALLEIPDDRSAQRVELDGQRCLVGRASRHATTAPQVDLGLDAGVSRRQAELAWYGDGWWVRDLSSANGTILRRASEQAPGHQLEREELMGDGDEVYVGSWSRLVLRRAND